jgi:hypothetical protein
MHAPSDISPLYLLFAGHHGEPKRGAGAIVATFSSQDEARAAFRQVRLNLANGEGWAELASVSNAGPVRRLSWFGQEAGRSVSFAPVLATATPAARSAQRRWRIRRHAG